MFHWNEGSLLGHTGPDEWQTELLKSVGSKLDQGLDSALRVAVTAANGVGKSALVSWLILWFLSTRPNPQVVVTANTAIQLSTKTWRELAKWHKCLLNRHWFQWTATKLYHVLFQSTWFAAAIPWSEENPEAFAGTHDENVLILCDEASGIADVIWDYVEGCITTPGSMWFVFGNPTRNIGKFYECFHANSHRWMTYEVDGRKAKMTNKTLIQEWIEDYGEDSDFVRIRVLAKFPRLSVSQFISSDSVKDCINRKLTEHSWKHFRPIIGVDVASGGGADFSVIVVRQGQFLHPPIKLYCDTMQLAGKVVEEYRRYGSTAVIAIDGVGMGTGVVHRLNELGLSVIDVQSAAKAIDIRTYANKRCELWGKMKDWILSSSCIPKEEELIAQLSSVEYSLNNKLQIVLQTKKDMRKSGKKSPDLADALAYTFSYDEALDFAKSSTAKPIRKVTWL